jgi:hypothetical protein
MRLYDFILTEGNIQISEISSLASRVIRNSITNFCEAEWKAFVARFPEYDEMDGDSRSKMHDMWYEENMSTSKLDSLVKGMSWAVGKELTIMLNEFVTKKTPPRFRNMRNLIVSVEIDNHSQDSLSKKAGGYYSDFDNMIKIFISLDDAIQTLIAGVHDYVFGESEGYDKVVDRITSIFIHEFVHHEQWKRGLAGRKTIGYVTTGGEKKSPRTGYHFSSSDGPVGKMRYHSSAHEIESFAAGAAIELTQEHIRRERYNQDGKIPDSIIDELCRDISMAYVETSQLKPYVWLRQYRDYYIEQGFKGHELETVFKRFMKVLYKKLQQFKRGPYTSSPLEKEWLRYTKWGLGETIKMIADDLQDKDLDHIWRGAQFINRIFFKDEWDMERSDKIEAVLKKLVKQKGQD